MIRACGFVFGLCAATYGGLSLWLSQAAANHPWRQPFCAAWLCPLEFSPARVYELHSARKAVTQDEAVREFTRALENQPASAYAWANLGEVLAGGDRTRSAAYCMERAVAGAPNSPVIRMRAANVALASQDYNAVMTYSSRILEDPANRQFFPAVFLTYGRMPLRIEEVLDRGVPERPWSADGLLRFLTASQRSADAGIAWRWIVGRALQTDQLSGDYLRFLIAHRQERAAAQAWAALNTKAAPDYLCRNWIFNGGFENAPRRVPLDWQLEPDDDVSISRSSESREGKSSLELRFAGLKNVQFEGVHQEAILPPGKWRVRASVRTDGVTTDQGIAIRVCDQVQSQRLDIATDALTGTHGWTQLEKVFELSPETKVVRVEIFRRASPRFDNKIAGTAWVDAVELSPVH